VTRLVVKLGSRSVARGDGLALDVIAGLVNQIAVAQRSGHEVLLVTSGAARLGRRLLEFEGPAAGAAPALRSLVDSVRSALAGAAGPGPAGRGTTAAADPRQEHERLTRSLSTTLGRYEAPGSLPGAVGMALPASVGQPALMALYRQLAAAVGVEVCQVLISKSDLDSAGAMRDLGRLLVAAAGRGLLPVINGNDTTDPMSALDNDQIAVAVAVAAEADRLLFLTDVKAAYRDASFSERIARLTPDEARAVRTSAAGTSRGGMRSKLNAAARAAYCGIECVISSAREPDVVVRSLNPRARLGTTIQPAGPGLPLAQRWIGGMAYPGGSVHLNREAELSLRSGSTLFLSGVKRVDGDFEAGSVVELVDVRHPERLIGRGSVALPSAILRLLRALSPTEVASAISIIFRLRYGTAGRDGAAGRDSDARQRAAARARMVNPEEFGDCRELTKSNSRAAVQVLEQIAAFSADAVAELTDSLMLAQPQLSAAVLLDGGFLAGQVPGEAAARRAARNIHAVHRDSLVIYPAG
jgi:glutamate 5-kinase